MYRMLKLASGLALAALIGCAPNVGTVDRTQPNAIDKSQFEGLWYHRAMVTEAAPESGQVEGITSGTEKVRWEITEQMLIAYRSYEFVPYAEGLTDEGRDFFGAPVAAYRILSHFDIQRDYNPVTGVENNVLVENSTDRPWFQRKYMRVDWSSNVVGGLSRFFIGWVNYPDAYFSGTALARYYQQGHVETDVDRPVFTRDYFDVTNMYSIEPDDYYCWMMLIYNGVPRCGAANVKVRLSFKKVDPKDDYESLYYPDVVELKDDTGNAIVLNGDGRPCGDNRDPSECSPQVYEYDAAFGNFRILRVAYDQERYLTRTGRLYQAGRFDLWEDSYDETGALIPHVNRKPKPIVYYGNVHFPDDMVEPATRMAAHWNVPFAETVAFLKGYTNADGKPDLARLKQEMGEDVYQFRINDCNPANIRRYAEEKGLADVVERVAGGLDNIAVGNVEQVCAAVQFAELQAGKTLDPKLAAEKGLELAFTWQRKGDLRYNFNNYIDQYQAGPWGVAQFAQDPETGEFIGANVANYFGDAGDLISQRNVDMIQWLNGDLSEQELLKGDSVRDTVISRRGVRNNSIRQAVKSALAAHEADIIEKSGETLVGNGRVGDEENRFERMFKGTDIEREILATDELLRGFAGPSLYQPFGALSGSGAIDTQGLGLAPGAVSPQALEALSPSTFGVTPMTNEFMKVAYEFGRRGFELASFFDPNISGLADFFKGADREEIRQWLRKELYLAVQMHEVGHTLGLRHNFQASMDALNYRPEFWWKENADGSVSQLWNAKATPENPSRRAEYMYASIMDYAFDIPQEGFHGIGGYDAAAIRFTYGQLADVFDQSKVSIPDPRKYGSWARRCGHNDDNSGLRGLLYWMGPSAIPRLLSVPAKDQSACASNYDQDTSCDTELDTLYRDWVGQMEAIANQNNWNFCAAFSRDGISTLNNMMRTISAWEPNPQAVVDSRKIVKVSDLIAQRVEMLKNLPEYDDPNTRLDESKDGDDQDGDGVADDKGFNWANYQWQVPYAYCSDLFANFSNPFCQRWDAGWDFTEATQNHIMKWDRDYIVDHYRRDALGTWGNPRAYMARLQGRRFFHMTNVYRYYLYTRRSAFEAPLFEDWREAAYRGLNFLERVIQDPEPGTYCLDTASNKYVPFSGTGTCNQRLELGLGYGQGRHLDSEWTDEYFYKTNRIGSFYDKLAAVIQMTSSSGFFARDFADLFDRRAFSLGYLRVFLDPMLQRFGALVAGDHTGYRPRVVSDEPNGERYVRYTPFFDESLDDGASVREWLRQYPEIEPSWSWSLQYWSLAWALANWSSVNDYAPEMYRFTKISIRGTPEDVDYPSNVTVVEFTDPETFITYRAPSIAAQAQGGLVQEFPAYYGDRWHQSRGMGRQWGIGAALLEDANRFLTTVWEPAQTACNAAAPGSEACRQFEAARGVLNQKVGFIDRIRKFNRRAEMSFQ